MCHPKHREACSAMLRILGVLSSSRVQREIYYTSYQWIFYSDKRSEYPFEMTKRIRFFANAQNNKLTHNGFLGSQVSL